MPGAPQQTMPQGVGMLPDGHVKSGTMPPIGLLDAMIQGTPGPLFATLPGTIRRSCRMLPSQLKAASSELATAFWNDAPIRITTYWAAGSPPAPDMTS